MIIIGHEKCEQCDEGTVHTTLDTNTGENLGKCNNCDFSFKVPKNNPFFLKLRKLIKGF